MAGLWNKVPEQGVLYPVTKQQFSADLLYYSVQTQPIGWQAVDSYRSFIKLTIAKFAEKGITVTEDTLIFYYVSDPTMDFAVIATPVPLNTQMFKQPYYMRINYGLDSLSGMISRVGVQLMTRWYFITTPLTDAADDGSQVPFFYLSLDGGSPLIMSDGSMVKLDDSYRFVS